MSTEAEKKIGEDTACLEDLIRAVVKCIVSELVMLLDLLVVKAFKCSIYPISNPDLVFTHSFQVTVCGIILYVKII
jgi:hypothetical protein